MSEQQFLQPRSHWFYNFAIVIAGLLAFVFVPLFFLSPEQTQQFINNGRELQVLADVTVLILLFYVALAAYYWALSLIRLKDIAATHIMFVFCWISFSGFLFPLTTARNEFDLRLAPTDMQNITIVVILSVIFSVLFVSKYWKIALVFMGTFLTLSIVPTLPHTFSQFEKQDIGYQNIKLSPEQNLILISLDGVPRHIMKDVLLENDAYSKLFRDFTFYSKVHGSSATTQDALRGIAYGNHDFSNPENRSWIDPNELYFNDGEKVELTTAFHYNIHNTSGKKLSAGQYGVAEQRDLLFNLYRLNVSRLTSIVGVGLLDVVDNYLFPDRKGKFFRSIDGFDQIVESVVIDSDKPAIFFSHFTFPHWPPIYDENCVDRSLDTKWFAGNQNEAGLKKVAVCGLKKYSELLSKLKEMDGYDNTTLIFISDHGMLWRFYATPPKNLTINNAWGLGYDRYLPFLMIKPENQKSDALTFSQKYVILDDLAPTMCNLFESPTNCESLPGVDILDDSDKPPDDFFIHVVGERTRSWHGNDLKSVKLPRGVPLLDAMRASDEIVLSEPQIDPETNRYK